MSRKKNKAKIREDKQGNVDIAEITGSMIDENPHNTIESTIDKYELSLEKQQVSAGHSDAQIIVKKRFIDDMDMIKKSENFVFRKHFGTTFPLFIAYLFVFVLSMMFVLTHSDSLGLTLMVAFLIGVGGVVNFYYLKKYHRVNNAIEFQNYIFANALRSESDFYFIFNDEGESVYSDSRLKNLMSSEESKDMHEIDLLMLTFEVNNEISNAIKHMVFEHNDNADGEKDRGDLLSYKISNPKYGKYAIMLKRLDKPMGYTVMKLVKVD